MDQPPDELPNGARPIDEWDVRQPTATNPGRRASVMLWVIAGLSIMAFTCFSAAWMFFIGMSPEQVRQNFPQFTPEQITQIHQSGGPNLILLFAIIFVPGVAYLIAAFGVRAGRPKPTNFALLLAIMQAIVWGVYFLRDLMLALRSAQPVQVTAVVLTQGTFLLLLGFAIHWLIHALHLSRNPPSGPSEPWNQRNP